MDQVRLDDEAPGARRIIWLLIAISAALMMSRLATVESRSGRTAMLSANDRSRWSTIRALVDHGHYEIDNVIFQRNGKRDPEWYTIDLVKHRGRDGRQHYYSSKPTLLTTVCAAPYYLMNRVGRLAIVDRPFYVVRASLAVLNIVPMVLFFWLLARLCESLAVDSRATIFVAAAAGFGTPLTTFAVTMNNHLPAAVSVLIATWSVLKVWRTPSPGTHWFALGGLSATFGLACELPALSFLAITAGLLLIKSWKKWLVGFVPAMLLVVLGMFGTNYLCHGTFATAYAYRGDGPRLAVISTEPGFQLVAGPISSSFHEKLTAAGINVGPDATILERPLGRGHAIWDSSSQTYYAVRPDRDGIEVLEWRNWYEYEGSYWSSGKKQGVDRGEPSKWVYGFHALAGHHGIISLTPIWLLSCLGAAIWLVRGDLVRRGISLITILLTVVCLVFFIALRPLEDRNYGGVSCCFRWTVWLTPFWLICLIPAIDFMRDRKWLWRTALVLLAISIFSGFYNSDNPWSHPWLFDYWSHLGWIKY